VSEVLDTYTQLLEKTVTTMILPMANMRHIHDGIGIYKDNWKINPISLLGGHGNRNLVYLAVLKGIV
jgi:hypothetical protein